MNTEGGEAAEGVPCWVDASLPDVEAGKRFYGELFGWSFDAVGPRGVAGGPRGAAWAHREGDPVAALLPKRDGRMPTVWTVYLATRDATVLTRRIPEEGGQVIAAPTPLGGLGRQALAVGPEGAVFGLWEPALHGGFGERRPASGGFARAVLHTRDPEAARPFWDGLFGGPRIAIAPLAGVFPEVMPSHFLVHFSVSDLESALGAVYRLGGRVQAQPFQTDRGPVAVVTDNQNASFALLES
ncbi:VOC family protein [Streptomyces abyssomicinicus]|uniref:VOC family protein n=1 Tax=Streptomyces abyssomicinicus TaxID=574929 RepID=UPI003F7684D9